MARNARPLVRVGAALFFVCVLVLAGLPASVHASAYAAPSSDGTVYVVKSGDRLVDIAARYGVSASAIVRENGLANADTIYPGQRLVIPGVTGSTPSPSSTPAPTAGSTGGQTATYAVQLGDTLASIARRFGVSTSALLHANNISNPDLIWVGQKLVVPAGGVSTAGQEKATATPQPTAIAQPTTALPNAPSAVAPTPEPQPTAAPTVETAATPTAAPSAAPTAEPSAAPALTSPKIHVVQRGETLSIIAKKYGVSVEALVSANGLGSADLIGLGVRLLIPGTGSSSSSGGTSNPGRATKFVTSISQQRCWLYSGQTVIARWICSTGRRGSGTRPGTYKIQSKMPKAYGSTWDIWMPFWMGIYWAGASENGIHGLPWNAKTGAQIWSGNVGKPITFGCVMLDNVNAKMLYDMAWIGMPVVIMQ